MNNIKLTYNITGAVSVKNLQVEVGLVSGDIYGAGVIGIILKSLNKKLRKIIYDINILLYDIS